MKKFQHFILTRFNVGLYNNNLLDKFGNKVNNDNKWMEHRIKLFEKYCFPSIKHQLNQNFTWLLLFDKKTPGKYFDKINKYQKYKNFVPVFAERFENYLKKHINKGTKYLITTRIDNDDAVHQKYINAIQEQFKHQERLLINFPLGYFYVEKENRLFLVNRLSNSYITLIEKIKKVDGRIKFKTVRCKAHLRLNRIGNIKQCATSTPMWVKIIHDRNLVCKPMGVEIPANLLKREDFGY